MRLAVVMPASTKNVGGVQRFSLALLEALAARCEVETISVHPQPGGHRLPALGRGAANLLRSHARRRFDAVLTTFHWPWKLIPGTPMAGFIHDLREHDLEHRGLKTRVQSGIIRSWNVVFVPSEHVAREVKTIAARADVRVVGEGLDHLERYWMPEFEEEERDAVVVIAGRAPHKRAELGVDAVQAALPDIGGDVVVLGSVPGRLPHPSIDVWTSYSDADLVKLYSRARVIVAPTSYEGFGLAAGEAMWFGAPVVFATDAKLGDLIRDGGVAAAPTVEGFRSAIVTAWNRHDSLRSKAIAAARTHTWASTAARIVTVLQQE